MFYSNTIFQNTSLSSNAVTCLIGAVNFAATLVVLGFLSKFGRKAIMVVTNALISMCLVVLGVCSLKD